MSNKVPQIRFNGYSDAWEERKSKDLFTPINERNRKDLPVLSVTQDQGVVLRNDLAIDIKYDKSTLSSYKVIHPGDFVISLRSFQGGFELSKVLGISSPAYTIFDLKNLTAHNKLYWKYIFKSFKFIESLKTVTFGIRDGKSISFREFSDLKINYPSDVSEQEKIGSFFQQLDETIDLHQRKLDLLKEQKKGYLQKMFPKNGAKVPELRFAGFADDWEERKLGDITKISTGKLDANAMVENGKYDFYTSGIKKYRIDIPAFEGPAITIAGNGATVGYMHLADNKFNAYQRTYVLQDFVVDRSFLFSEVGNKLPKKINQEARTGNIPYIVMDMLTQLKLSIPQDEAEQSKIGSFFKQLDNTIALHQRKLDLLKEQKKGFLQKMFV